MVGEVRPFSAFQVQITSRCNLHCRICTRTSFAKGWVEGDMDMVTYQAVARAFPYVKQVYLDAWGEPLLNPHFWEMVALARDNGCSVGVTTNGVLLDSRVAELLARNLDVVGISVDGATPHTYERMRIGARFEKVIQGIEDLVAARKALRSDGLPLISLLFLKTNENIHELPAFVDLAGTLGVDEVIASNLSYVTQPAHDLLKAFSLHAPSPAHIEILEQVRCKAKSKGLGLRLYPLAPKRVPFCEARPLEELHVTWEGLVAPCVYLTLPVAGDVIFRVYEGVRYPVPKTHFGDLRVSSLLEIWEQEDYRQFREPFAKRSAACGGVPFGPSGDGGFRELDGPAFDAVTRYSLPDVCRGCYKAMGL